MILTRRWLRTPPHTDASKSHYQFPNFYEQVDTNCTAFIQFVKGLSSDWIGLIHRFLRIANNCMQRKLCFEIHKASFTAKHKPLSVEYENDMEFEKIVAYTLNPNSAGVVLMEATIKNRQEATSWQKKYDAQAPKVGDNV